MRNLITHNTQRNTLKVTEHLKAHAFRKKTTSMSNNMTASLHTLPVELTYRILDNVSDLTLLVSCRNVCARLNTIIDTYHRYKVILLVLRQCPILVIFEACSCFSKKYIILINFTVLGFKEIDFIRQHSIPSCVLSAKIIQKYIGRYFQEFLELHNALRKHRKY